MGNTNNGAGDSSPIYTKNYVRFIRDSLRIIEYCESALSARDKEEIIQLLKKIQESKVVANEMALYDAFLRIRKSILMRNFEGAFLSRQSLKYTIHEYTYLKECIKSSRKALSSSEVNEIRTLLQDTCNGDNVKDFLSELDKHSCMEKLGFTFFENSFFRGSSYQAIHLSDYHRYLVEKSNEYQSHLTMQWPLSQKDQQLLNVAASAEPDPNWRLQDSQVENLVITVEEFWILHKFFIKHEHKISYISQIPSTTLNLYSYLQNLTMVRELQLSSMLDQRSQLELLQFLQDNPLLEKISVSLDSPIQSQIITTLNNHPHLQYISLQVNQTDRAIRQLRKLKRILIKADMLWEVLDMVDPEQVTLSFEIKNMRFSPQVMATLSKFPRVFLTCANNFFSLACTLFRELSSKEQVAFMQYFLNSTNIIIDSLLSFTQNEDLQRMNNGTLNLGVGGYLYLFMTKLLIEYEQAMMIEMMKFAAFEIHQSIFQTFNPLRIYNDLYLS